MLDPNDILNVVLRWMHVFAAIAAVGGTFFMRLALLPAMESLPPEHRPALAAAVRARWAKYIHAAILLLLISGLVNIVLIVQRYDVPSPAYHALFGVKFLLALGIFYIASMLLGRSQAAERFRQRARFWVTLNMLLAIALVAISSVLKVMPHEMK